MSYKIVTDSTCDITNEIKTLKLFLLHFRLMIILLPMMKILIRMILLQELRNQTVWQNPPARLRAHLQRLWKATKMKFTLLQLRIN